MQKNEYYCLQVNAWNTSHPEIKSYVGTIKEFDKYFKLISHEPDDSMEIQALLRDYSEFKAGNKEAQHYVAGHNMQLLTPVEIISRKEMTINGYRWKHNEKSYYPIDMRCRLGKLELIWLCIDGDDYRRYIKGRFTDIQFFDEKMGWIGANERPDGFPHMVERASAGTVYSRFAVLDAYLGNRDYTEADSRKELLVEELDLSGIYEDIFSDELERRS